MKRADLFGSWAGSRDVFIKFGFQGIFQRPDQEERLMAKNLKIRRPDDMHLHLRDGALLEAVIRGSAAHFARALIMPNLLPPVVDVAMATAYRNRILSVLPAGTSFIPLMALYLTEDTPVEAVSASIKTGFIKAFKLYPGGVTTNSQSGIRNMETIYPVLEVMEEAGMILCVHGEVSDPEVDIFDREVVFLEKVLEPIRQKFPQLFIVMEHITTAQSVSYVKDSGPKLAATITTHHLVINRNHLLSGGIKPHYYCLPVAKREEHRLSLIEAATSGQACFFLGTDSAPHSTRSKESACGCAGIYSAPITLSCLCEIFEQAGVLDQLEAFTSVNGANFYALPLAKDFIELERQADPVVYPDRISLDSGETITLFSPVFDLHWRVI